MEPFLATLATLATEALSFPCPKASEMVPIDGR
jgi:hypothetical protein